MTHITVLFRTTSGKYSSFNSCMTERYSISQRQQNLLWFGELKFKSKKWKLLRCVKRDHVATFAKKESCWAWTLKSGGKKIAKSVVVYKFSQVVLAVVTRASKPQSSFWRWNAENFCNSWNLSSGENLIHWQKIIFYRLLVSCLLGHPVTVCIMRCIAVFVQRNSALQSQKHVLIADYWAFVRDLSKHTLSDTFM